MSPTLKKKLDSMLERAKIRSHQRDKDFALYMAYKNHQRSSEWEAPVFDKDAWKELYIDGLLERTISDQGPLYKISERGLVAVQELV